MQSLMAYEEALDFLVGLTKFGFNFGLQRIEYLLQLLGDPHRKLRVVHVGGTNGKGSTAMMAARVLEAAGYRVGLFTSPHLDSYTERYLINQVPISEPKLAELISRVRPYLEEMVRNGHEHPTEFEVCTAIAFLYFYEEQVDFLVLEVGLGGAIDSTNIIPTPLAAVITNVAFDHMDYLGNTIQEIATVKAGIIKQGGDAVTAASDPDALAVIVDRCREVGASLLRVGVELGYDLTESTPFGTSFNLRSPWGDYPGLWVPLAGQYQAINAATALGAIEILRRRHGVQITYGSDQGGFCRRQVAGPPGTAVRAPGGAGGCHPQLRRLPEAAGRPAGDLPLPAPDPGAGDAGGQGAGEGGGRVGAAGVSGGDHQAEQPPGRGLGDAGHRGPPLLDTVLVIEEITAAVDAALKEAGCEDLVCVTGSFYMVAEARAYLRSVLRDAKCLE